MKVVIDSDILIEILRGNEEIIKLFEKIKDEELLISAINEGELLAGRECENGKILKKTLKFLGQFKKVDVNNEIVRKAGEFSRKYGAKLIDCIIASTAYLRGAKVFTLNEKDFRRIKEIDIL